MDKKILRFKNREQKLLFENELQGQISDGKWENTRPLSHYKAWCNCEVEVGEDYGRNFYAEKDNYNFLDKELLEIVGGRMLACVRLVKHFGTEDIDTLMSPIQADGSWWEMPTGDKYWDDKRALLETIGIDEVKRISQDESLYSMKQMKKDLKEMKMIVRTRF